ncbi:MAG: hypothetical protein JXA62_02475 [Candidatus Aminicenantes bacterium]|nr:hypothetical protein [Candidatus Aminicenantes bacterium]
MTGKEIENISEYFYSRDPQMSAEDKWQTVFQQWVNRIEEKKLLLSLYELKLWLESTEAFFSSRFLESQIFRFSTAELRNYSIYLNTFTQVSSRIIQLLKEVDFKKDKFLLNFEEFIVEEILEIYTSKSFPTFSDTYSPESWFSSLRIFLQNLRHLCSELVKGDVVTQRTFSSIKKLYHKELTLNPIIMTLIKKRFIPKMDKIYQPDISRIISRIEEKDFRRQIGLFFLFAFRVMKINNFIESNLNRSRNIDHIIPLILALKRSQENLYTFHDNLLREHILAHLTKKQAGAIQAILEDFKQEYQKIFEGELPNFFDTQQERADRRKVLKNIVIICDMAIKELIEATAQVFDPQVSGGTIFENYISRKEKSGEVRARLSRLHAKINDYFSRKEHIPPSDILFDLNLFIETDLNQLQYKDWNEFLYFYNHLTEANFSDDFDVTLKSFHSFITTLLKGLVKGQ